jgi:hypothetical protein
MSGALLTLFAVRSRAEVWLLFAVMTAYGLSLVLIDAGESAVLQGGVPPPLQGPLNGVRMSVQEGMKLVAPLAGALLFTVAGGRSVAALSAAALLGAGFLYTRVHYGETKAARETGLLAQTVDGLRHLFADRALWTVVLIAAVAVGLSGLGAAASLEVITLDLHRAPAFAGVTGSAQGAGSILGGLIGGALLSRFGERLIAVAGSALTALGTLGLCIPALPVTLGARVTIGVGLPWTVVAAFTAVQRRTNPALIGQVAANTGTLVFAPVAVTTAIGAALITVIDHRLVLALAAALTLAAALALGRRNRTDLLDGGVDAALPRGAVAGKNPGHAESGEPVEGGERLLRVIGERGGLGAPPAGQHVAGGQRVTDEDGSRHRHVDGDAARRVTR